MICTRYTYILEFSDKNRKGGKLFLPRGILAAGLTAGPGAAGVDC
jgi:hypothetical protein